MSQQSDEAKLAILLAHWVEHNEAHAREFRDWAERAKRSGRESVHDRITQAAQQMSRLNDLLLQALQELEES